MFVLLRNLSRGPLPEEVEFKDTGTTLYRCGFGWVPLPFSVLLRLQLKDYHISPGTKVLRDRGHWNLTVLFCGV